jgi:hypothetical protein
MLDSMSHWVIATAKLPPAESPARIYSSTSPPRTSLTNWKTQNTPAIQS